MQLLETKNKALFDRAYKASENLQLAEKAKLTAEVKAKENASKYESMFHSMSKTQAHVQTILESNAELSKRNEEIQLEANKKLKEVTA